MAKQNRFQRIPPRLKHNKYYKNLSYNLPAKDGKQFWTIHWASLASQPFCLDADNLYDEVKRTDQLIGKTLYFKGYNKQNLDSAEDVNNESTLFDNLSIDDFSDELYSLDYLLEDVNRSPARKLLRFIVRLWHQNSPWSTRFTPFSGRNFIQFAWKYWYKWKVRHADI